jgi:hypothetical protein
MAISRIKKATTCRAAFGLMTNIYILISALLTPTIPVGFPRETPLHVVSNSSDRWIFSRAPRSIGVKNMKAHRQGGLRECPRSLYCFLHMIYF